MDVSVKKNSLLVYVLTFFGIFGSQCGSVVVTETGKDERYGFDSGLRCSFVLIETLSIIVKNF